jgi:RNA-directed DNA polymerase
VRESFDRLDRTRRGEVRRQRLHEGRIWRLMGQWLRAGVMEEGARSRPESGVVQGGVMSPVVAKVCRHHVLDDGCTREVRPCLKGRGCRRRLADDVVMGGERAADARRIMAVLPKRLARFGLSLHPEQTRLRAFRPPETRKGPAQGNGTVDGLGLTYDWTQSRRGFGGIKRRTARKRLRRTKTAWWWWGRTHRQAPVKGQPQRLGLKRRGHCRDSGIRGHCRLFEEGLRVAERARRYWLSRRRRTGAMGWETFQQRLTPSVLPTPTIVPNI